MLVVAQLLLLLININNSPISDFTNIIHTKVFNKNSQPSDPHNIKLKKIKIYKWHSAVLCFTNILGVL